MLSYTDRKRPTFPSDAIATPPLNQRISLREYDSRGKKSIIRAACRRYGRMERKELSFGIETTYKVVFLALLNQCDAKAWAIAMVMGLVKNRLRTSGLVDVQPLTVVEDDRLVGLSQDSVES
jgi:hypothetical protein